MSRAAPLVILLSLAVACSSSETKEYELSGQILALAPERNEVTIRHGDIPSFMPAMTMAFTVEEAALLDGKQPGDLVTATLVVGEANDAHLSSLATIGHEPLPEPSPDDGVRLLQEGDLVSDAAFVNQDGEPVTLASLRGHRLALTFIYSRCPFPEFCPLMNRRFFAVQKAIRSRDDLKDVRLLSITLDPEYDRPPVLKAHADTWDADPSVWSFLTGEPDALRDFSGPLGLYSEVDTANPSQTVHNLRTAVIGPDGRLVTIRTGNEWTATDLLADLEAAPAPAH